MLIVEIDVIDAEPLERAITRFTDVFRAAVHPEKTAVLPTLVAEFGSENYPVSAAPDGLANKTFVGEGPVPIGRVQKVDA
jgi:hypothetical protein